MTLSSPPWPVLVASVGAGIISPNRKDRTMMHKRLYYHKTDGGAEDLTDRWARNPDGRKEIMIENAKIIVRIDPDITQDAEITLADELFTPING